MATYKTIRSIQRGFEVLAALNRQNGASVQTIAETTRIHRTTVHRILETLHNLGYVKKSPSDENYRLTLNVRQLSDGFDDDAWISAIAVPALRELHQKILWPANVATYDYDAMLVRESTHRYSPLAIHHAVVGQRLAMLRTALGRAYFCFCPEDERREILRILQAGRGRDAAIARDPGVVRDLVRKARQDGYVVSHSEKDRKIAAIAVPIVRGGRVFAAINIVFFHSAMSVSAAVERYLGPLRDTAAEIADRLEIEYLWTPDTDRPAAAKPAAAAKKVAGRTAGSR